MTALPPYAALLELQVVEEGDELVFAMPFHDGVVGRPGFLHGGAIAGLLEFAAFETLARSIGDANVRMKPVTVTVDYLRGARKGGGATLAQAIVERLGKRIANVDAIAWQGDRERPVATARINFLLDRPGRG